MTVHLWDHDTDLAGNEDDLIVEATVRFLPGEQQWYAVAPWEPVLHRSDVRDRPDHWANHVDWEALHGPATIR